MDKVTQDRIMDKVTQDRCKHYRDSVVVVGRTAAVCVDCGKIFG